MAQRDRLDYRNIHNWVTYHLGRPHNCEICGNKDLEHRQYHWSNISGQYKRDLSDWRRLCASCHRNIDHKNGDKGYCVRGHKMTKSNTYFKKHRKSTGSISFYPECRDCRKIVKLQWELSYAGKTKEA